MWKLWRKGLQLRRVSHVKDLQWYHGRQAREKLTQAQRYSPEGVAAVLPARSHGFGGEAIFVAGGGRQVSEAARAMWSSRYQVTVLTALSRLGRLRRRVGDDRPMRDRIQGRG